MKTRAIMIHEHGGPAVLRAEDVDLGPAPDGAILVRHEYVGVNFVDTYVRSGLYPGPDPPFVLGTEAVGIVESAAADAGVFQRGARVAYVDPLGAYCERRWMPVERLVLVPDSIEPRAAAAVLLKGLTVHYLVRRSYPVGPGDIVLVHAAAGGVGRLLCQWARHLGARVIGTVGDEAKVAPARESGCEHVILYEHEDLVDGVERISGGRGASVVYDGVGRATFERSLACVAEFGTIVAFGNASGPVAPVDILSLAPKSVFLTRPTLRAFTRRARDLRRGAREVFDLVREGVLRPHIHDVLPLDEAARAHEMLHARRATGSLLLRPENHPTGTP